MGEKGEEQLQSQTQHKGLFWQCGSRIQYLKQNLDLPKYVAHISSVSLAVFLWGFLNVADTYEL